MTGPRAHSAPEKAGPRVSVVIPCLNEAGTLGSCVDRARKALEEAGLAGEVVVADNGSTDGSGEIGVLHGARVVPVTERGYGSALRGGIEAAVGPVVVVGDADGQHDFSELGALVGKLDEGYDMVVGNRFAGEIHPGSMRWTHRYVGNPVLSGLLRVLFHPGIHDAQSGMRAFTKTAFTDMDLRTTGFEICPEMVVKAVRHHLRITEIPVGVHPPGRGRPAHLRSIPDGWRHLMFLLMCAPNWLFLAPGGALLSFGIGLVAWIGTGPQHLGHTTLDTRAQLFGAIAASLGLQIVSIGLFARVFSYSDPRRVRTRSLTRALGAARLEWGLALGGSLVLVGVGGDAWQLFHWVGRGFGVVRDDRVVVFWSLWALLGVQVWFSSFFLSMIGISRGTWIGEGR